MKRRKIKKIVLGIALWRARAVPTWAAVLIMVSRLLVLFLYPFTMSVPGIYLQLLGWAVMLIGSIPAALAMAKGAPQAETPGKLRGFAGE